MNRYFKIIVLLLLPLFVFGQKFRQEIQNYTDVTSLRNESLTPRKNDKVYIHTTKKLYAYDHTNSTSTDDGLNYIVQTAGSHRWVCLNCHLRVELSQDSILLQYDANDVLVQRDTIRLAGGGPDKFNANIVATTTYDHLNTLAGWVAPSNPIQGNTVEVKFTDGTVANYTFNGTAWVFNFDATTYKLKSCSGVDLAKDTKVHQVQNLNRATGFGVNKLDNVDCLSNNDEYYNADLYAYQGSSSQGNTATHFYARVLNGQNTNAGGYMSIAAQRDNSITSAYGVIFGRANNSNSGEYNSIIGGSNGVVSSNVGSIGRNMILQGSGNAITGFGVYNSVLNGDANSLTNSNNFILSGTTNSVNNTNVGYLTGGFNTINNSVSQGSGYIYMFGSQNQYNASRVTNNNYIFGGSAQQVNTIYAYNLGEDNRLYDNLITSTNNAYLTRTYSFGIGHRLRMYGKENFAFGYKLQTASLKHIAIGFENVQYSFSGVDDDDLATSTFSKEIGYQLGIGSGGNRTDAHAVRKDGRQMFRALWENTGFTGAFTPANTTFISAFEFNTTDQSNTSAFGGVRLAPMTQAQRNAMSTSMYQDGDIIYCKDCLNPENGFNGVYQYYQASSGTWINMH